MRRILIDNAKRKRRLKHGGDWQRIHLTTLDVAITSYDEQLLALGEALEAATNSTGSEGLWRAVEV